MNNKIATLLKPRAWLAKFLILAVFTILIGLIYFDYLDPVRAFLSKEALTLEIGELKLTPYIVLKSIITIVILFWGTGIFSEFGERRIKSIKNINPSNRALITKAFQIAIYFLAFIIGLDILGIDLTALAIFSGAVGIGIGFGLQKITSNFISGIILLFEKSIENDDLVELTDGTYGFIRHTRARYTLIETLDGKEIMIPNEDFITNRVTNWTFSNTYGRIDILIGVSYDSDIEKARELILEAAKEHERCIEEPAPACYLVDFGESSVNFQLYFWISNVSEGRLEPKSDVLRNIWQKFADNNISIPFPQRDVHIKNPGLLK